MRIVLNGEPHQVSEGTTVARLDSDSGRSHIGIGTQSVLWCDPRVLAAHSESADIPGTRIGRVLTAELEAGQLVTG